MRKLIGAVVALALMPSTAWAGWEIEVKDLTTSQVWTYKPSPSSDDFVVPFAMSGWNCGLGRMGSGRDKYRELMCFRGDSEITSRLYPKVPFPVSFTLSSREKGSHLWRVYLSYK